MSVKGLVEQLSGSANANAILVSTGTLPQLIGGENDAGDTVNLHATPDNHLEVAIHAPRMAFGAVEVDSGWAIFQCDAVYGVNAGQVLATTSLSGTATASNGSFVCTTGTTIYGFGTLQSRKRARYRPGQGLRARWTAKFTAPVTNSIQVVGLGHAEDGVYFGYNYNSTELSILYSVRGVRETRAFTISTRSTTAESVTITLNGVAFSVPVTVAATTSRTAYELTQFTYAGWNAYCVDSIVYFIAASAGARSGTYSYTASTMVGSFAQTKAGAAATETWIPRSSWNGDKLDGTGPSGFTLDPTKYNVYQVSMQYLGAGTVVFQAEYTSGTSNSDFATVHSLQLPNTLTAPSFGNPSFPFTMASYSAGSTTDVNVQSASFAAFVEGNKKLSGNRFCYFNTITTVTSAAYQVLFTIQNQRYFGGRANQGVINVLTVSGAVKHTQPCALYLFRNTNAFRHTLAGSPNFASYHSTSCALYDTAATTFTLDDNSQLVWVGQLPEVGSIDHHFNLDMEELTLQPGEYLSLCARSSTGSPAYVSGSINTREDI